MREGSLTIVGTGIKAISHLTNEARIQMERAEILFYLVADPLTLDWINEAFPNSVSLKKHYVEDRPRLQSYNAMVEEVLSSVRLGRVVCCAFYGHPSVFVYPSHEMIRLCKMEGFAYEMCPAVSADACLFADLSIDPAKSGLMSYEATDFLVFDRPFSPRCALILWQVGVIGDLAYHEKRDPKKGLSLLRARLLTQYSATHQAFLYEAASIPLMLPSTVQTNIGALEQVPVTAITTMYVPPERKSSINMEVVSALNLDLKRLHNKSTAFMRNCCP